MTGPRVSLLGTAITLALFGLMVFAVGLTDEQKREVWRGATRVLMPTPCP